jgi:glucosamine--fructose-6-phosphate aminotransferase (isomerizing)
MASKMQLESASSPSVVAGQVAKDEGLYKELGASLRSDAPGFVCPVARGSSSHACCYGSHLITARLGLMSAQLPPSAVTLFGAPLKLRGSLAVGLSQSGKSPDIVATLDACGKAGARTIAFVNAEDSPMAKLAGTVLPLHAGPELSVAATKTYVASLSALARLVGHWGQDEALLEGLKALPDAMEKAQAADLGPFVELFRDKERALVLGRGPSWPVALEAALKFKETCSLQAEAFTSAEVKHGPKALVGQGYPLVVFAPRGKAQADLLAAAKDMCGAGAKVIVFSASDADLGGATTIRLPQAPHPALDPLVLVQAFHLAVERLAQARGLNPDEPPHLAKVTMTV